MDIISWIKTTLSKYSSNSTHDKNAIYFVKNEDGKTGKIISDEIVYGNGGDANGVVVESPNQPTGGESVWVNPDEDPEEVEVYNRSQVDAIHQDIVDSITSLSEAGYLFSGVATSKTNPGTPDAKVFYIANGKGTYEKFGGVEVTEDEVVVLYWDTAWHKVSTGIASDEKLSELEGEINGKVTNNSRLNLYSANNIYKTITYSICSFAFNVERCENIKLKAFSGVYFRVYGANSVPSEGVVANKIIELPVQSEDGYIEVNVSGYKYVTVQYNSREISSTDAILDSGLSILANKNKLSIKSLNGRIAELEGIIHNSNPLQLVAINNILTPSPDYHTFAFELESSYISFPVFKGLNTKVLAFNVFPSENAEVAKVLAEFGADVEDGIKEADLQGYKYITIQYITTQVTKSWVQTDMSMSSFKKELDVLKNEISVVNDKVNNIKGFNKDGASHWILGLYNNGIYEQHTTRITHDNKELINLSKGDIISVETGYKYIISFFDRTGNYKKMTSWTTESTVIQEESYVIFVVARNDNSTIKPEDVDFVAKSLHILTPFSELAKKETSQNGVVERNAHRLDALYAITRSNIKGSLNKDFASMICSDMHFDLLALSNAIEYVNSNDRIDTLFLLGDQVSTFYKKPEVDKINEVISTSVRPIYSVIGNHDVGSFPGIGVTGSHKQMYDSFIKPMIDKGWLIGSEIPTNASEGKPYYYHDFGKYKIRIIALYEYDQPMTSADMDTRYWKPITYSSLYETIAYNTAYIIGAKVNVKDETGYGYTDYSFECVQSCTTPSNGTKERVEEAYKLPTWKIHRGYRVIRQEQAQWFLNTLLSTPSGYSVIVMCHNPYSENMTSQKDKKFCSNIDNPIIYTRMDDFVSDAINAFQNGLNFVHKVRMKDEAEYLNVNTDASGNYAYEVSCDFRNKNAGARFACLFGGHMHLDAIFKHNTYNQYQVLATTANTSQVYIGGSGADMPRAKEDCLSYDCLTVVGQDTDTQKIRLMKIGQMVTTDCTLRDQEVIGLN